MKVVALFVSAWFLVLSFSFSEMARAEEAKEAKEAKEAEEAKEGKFYVGLFGGFAYPEKLRNVNDVRTGAQLPDRSVGASFFDDPDRIFGGKVGFIPEEEYTWFGVEGEFFTTSTKAKAIPGGLASTTVDIKALALNFLIRYPRYWLQPYVGVGPTLIWANSLQLEGRDSGITTAGLNMLAGLRVPIADRFMLFAEYKHNRADLDFNNFDVDYRLHAGVGGIAIMF